MLAFKRARKLSGVAALALMLAAICGAEESRPAPRPGFNLFSKQQDIELGRQAAAQVRQQYQVVQNQELQNYIRSIGQKLASTQEAHDSGFPFEFTLLNAKEVNAFALPGGPTFVFTGLIQTADNEGELAGVLAHEISHVILRHGTNQASKANLLQIPAAIAGMVAGQSTMGRLLNLGVGLGLNGLMLKYSRTDESQADALGARIMSEARYNPIEMAHLFEKLQQQGGPGVPQFLSDHPNPGNRVKAIEAEIRTLPQHQYTAGTGNFEREKQLVAQLPPPPPQRAPQQSAGGSASGGFRQLATQRFALQVPADWQASSDPGNTTIALAPRGALVQGQSGETTVGAGAIISYYTPQGGSRSLEEATRDLLNRLSSANPSIRVASGQKRVTVSGAPALLTQMASGSPFGGGERDILLTTARPEGLFYMVLVAPDQNFGQLTSAFQRMLQSLQFRQ